MVVRGYFADCDVISTTSISSRGKTVPPDAGLACYHQVEMQQKKGRWALCHVGCASGKRLNATEPIKSTLCFIFIIATESTLPWWRWVLSKWFWLAGCSVMSWSAYWVYIGFMPDALPGVQVLWIMRLDVNWFSVLVCKRMYASSSSLYDLHRHFEHSLLKSSCGWLANGPVCLGFTVFWKVTFWALSRPVVFEACCVSPRG